MEERDGIIVQKKEVTHMPNGVFYAVQIQTNYPKNFIRLSTLTLLNITISQSKGTTGHDYSKHSFPR